MNGIESRQDGGVEPKDIIPPFQPNGYLPAGIHEATWQQATQRLGTNPHRRTLLQGLLQALENLRQSGCRKIYLDGSFATNKELPGDFDVAWETADVDPQLLNTTLLDFSNRRQAQKLAFGGELFPADWEADDQGRTFLDFFQTDQQAIPKGIIAIDLRTLP